MPWQFRKNFLEYYFFFLQKLRIFRLFLLILILLLLLLLVRIWWLELLLTDIFNFWFQHSSNCFKCIYLFISWSKFLYFIFKYRLLYTIFIMRQILFQLTLKLLLLIFIYFTNIITITFIIFLSILFFFKYYCFFIIILLV